MNAANYKQANQQGAVTALFVLLMMVILIGAVIAITRIAASDIDDTTGTQDAVAALYLAESGMERAHNRYSNLVVCGAPLQEAAIALGRGQFTISNAFITDFDDITLLSATQCRVQVTGTITGSNASRTIEQVLDLNLLPGSANTDFNITEPPPDRGPSATCDPADPCNPAGWALAPLPPSTFKPWRDNEGPDGTRAAFVQKTASGLSTATGAGNFTFAPPVVVTAPITLTITFDLRVERLPTGGNKDEAEVTFRLIDTFPTTYTGTDGFKQTGAAFINQAIPITITGAGPKTISNLEFELKAVEGRPKNLWLDNISLNLGAAPTPAAWRQWRELARP